MINILPHGEAQAAYSYQGKVTADVLNVRVKPGTSYAIAGKLKRGQTVTVSAQQNGWAKVSSGKTAGWASSKYISSVNWRGYVNATSLNMRSLPTTRGKVIASLPKSTVVTVQGTESSWLKVYVPSKKKTGWVSQSYISKNQPTVAPTSLGTRYVTASSLNVRNKPSTSGSVIGSVKQNTAVQVLSKSGTWSKIKNNGLTGWSASSYLTEKKPSGKVPAPKPKPTPTPPTTPTSSSALRGKTIVVDAGHGGVDPGASGRSFKEKALALNSANSLASLLRRNGARVIMTRTSDVYLSLSARVNISHAYNPDAFVSLHYNSFNSMSSGVETFYYSYAKESGMANYVQRGLVASTGMKNRGARFGNYHVLRENRRPAILVELGFLSNPAEEKLVASASYQQRAVQGMYNGLVGYFSTR